MKPGRRSCGLCMRPLIPLARASATEGPKPLWLCPYCDVGGNPSAGPPILLNYLRKGHE